VSTNPPESAAIAETRLLHKMHRAAAALLADAAQRDTAPPEAPAELRDFLVAALRHHHESEDDVLWPRLIAADLVAGAGLTELGAEHETLDALAVAPVREGADRKTLAAAAATVRDLVHQHLGHEEPVFFPALAAHMTDEAWAEFSRAVIASAPPAGAHLNIGFFEEVGTPAELEVVAGNLPRAVLPLVPAMREQARTTLSSLRTTHDVRTVTA
jgi:hemerythrin-like domain-containing protein